MVLVSVLLFDSTPAWNKRRLLYVKLLPPPPPLSYPATGEPQLLRQCSDSQTVDLLTLLTYA